MFYEVKAMGFPKALAENPAFKKLGDTRLSLDTPVLLGEARRPRPWLLSTGLWGLAVATALSLCAWLLVGDTARVGPWPFLLALVTALFMLGATYLEQGNRRRRFLLDFSTHTLRLDFSTPFRGLPRSVTVPFSAVKSVDIVQQADGRKALIVDFEKGGQAYREVLAAHVQPGEQAGLQRLLRLLCHALELPSPELSDSVFHE